MICVICKKACSDSNYHFECLSENQLPKINSIKSKIIIEKPLKIKIPKEKQKPIIISVSYSPSETSIYL